VLSPNFFFFLLACALQMVPVLVLVVCLVAGIRAQTGDDDPASAYRVPIDPPNPMHETWFTRMTREAQDVADRAQYKAVVLQIAHDAIEALESIDAVKTCLAEPVECAVDQIIESNAVFRVLSGAVPRLRGRVIDTVKLALDDLRRVDL
jgi:hypothetical protein